MRPWIIGVIMVGGIASRFAYFYNPTVRDDNTTVQSFPSLLVAALFSFHPEPFFQLAHENERAVPKVEFER